MSAATDRLKIEIKHLADSARAQRSGLGPALRKEYALIAPRIWTEHELTRYIENTEIAIRRELARLDAGTDYGVQHVAVFK